MLVKVLYGPGECEHARNVCDDLELGPWDAPADRGLVRASFVAVNYDLPPTGGRRGGTALSGAELPPRLLHSMHALLMRRYAQSLALAPQLDLAAVRVGVVRLQGALQFMHSRGWVHMDVKSDNVVMDTFGQWLLCDIGSCTRTGQPVTSYTDRFHPERLMLQAAVPGYDWDMLLVLLLVEADKKGWQGLLSVETSRVSTQLLYAALERLTRRGARPTANTAGDVTIETQQGDALQLCELAASLESSGTLGLAGALGKLKL